MILNNIKEAKQFLPSLNLTLDNDRFKDFFRSAQLWLVANVIGTDIEDVLETDFELGHEDIHEDLRRLCQRVIAEKALLTVIPEMDMQLTEAGFAVQNNADYSPASSQRVDRLLQTLPKRMASDADALVRYLMECSIGNGAYGYWRSSQQFMRLTAAFNPYWTQYCLMANPSAEPIGYDAFLERTDRAAKAILKVADYYVSRAEIERLRELYRDGDTLEEHRTVIDELVRVGIAAVDGDMRRARDLAAYAHSLMIDDIGFFPEFAASKAYNATHINLDGGNVVNFL